MDIGNLKDLLGLTGRKFVGGYGYEYEIEIDATYLSGSLYALDIYLSNDELNVRKHVINLSVTGTRTSLTYAVKTIYESCEQVHRTYLKELEEDNRNKDEIFREYFK